MAWRNRSDPGYHGLHSLLSKLPVPVANSGKTMSHAAALEGGFLSGRCCAEMMEDPIFKGNQNFKFEIDLDEAGKRLFGGEANAGVAFQIGQLRYVILIYMYIHY